MLTKYFKISIPRKFNSQILTTYLKISIPKIFNSQNDYKIF